jgi:hypothetical protein
MSSEGQAVLGATLVALGAWSVARPSFAADTSKRFFDIGFRSIGAGANSDSETRRTFVRAIGAFLVVLGGYLVIDALA